MDEKPGDVLTIEELSAYLKIPKSTLYKLVREGKVPCQKIGRHWRFRKEAIDRWLEETHGDTTNRQDSRFARPKVAPQGESPGTGSLNSGAARTGSEAPARATLPSFRLRPKKCWSA